MDKLCWYCDASYAWSSDNRGILSISPTFDSRYAEAETLITFIIGRHGRGHSALVVRCTCDSHCPVIKLLNDNFWHYKIAHIVSEKHIHMGSLHEALNSTGIPPVSSHQRFRHWGGHFNLFLKIIPHPSLFLSLWDTVLCFNHLGFHRNPIH